MTKKDGRSTVYHSGLSKDYDALVSKENQKLIREFIGYMKSVDKSPQTISQYEAQLKIWAVWNAKENDNTFFIDMKKRQFVRFFSYLQTDLNVSSNRICSLRAVLSSFSNFIERIMDDDYPTFRNIVKVLEPVNKTVVREKTILTVDEVKECLEELVKNKKYQAAAFLAVAASSGARKAELIQFKVSDFEENHLVFNGAAYETEPVRSKGRGRAGNVVSKIVFANVCDVKKYVDLWVKHRIEMGVVTNDLFTSSYGGTSRATISTANSFVSVIEKYLGKSVYSHAFRHMCCTHLLQIGIPKEVVQQIFRWKTDQVPTYDDRDKDKELANFMIEFNRKNSI